MVYRGIHVIFRNFSSKKREKCNIDIDKNSSKSVFSGPKVGSFFSKTNSKGKHGQDNY